MLWPVECQVTVFSRHRPASINPNPCCPVHVGLMSWHGPPHVHNFTSGRWLWLDTTSCPGVLLCTVAARFTTTSRVIFSPPRVAWRSMKGQRISLQCLYHVALEQSIFLVESTDLRWPLFIITCSGKDNGFMLCLHKLMSRHQFMTGVTSLINKSIWSIMARDGGMVFLIVT